MKNDSRAENLKIAIVVSRWNDFITKRLLEGAHETLLQQGLETDAITTAWVPGCFEIPLACKLLAETKEYHAIITLGCVIRGETAHFDYVAGEAAKGISSVSLSTNTPVIFGILTCESTQQAIERAGLKLGNKGVEAAHAAIQMAGLVKRITSTLSSNL